jgi:hypothetical protein
MKQLFILICMSVLLCSCGLFHHGSRYGCPSNGKNVDAGKLAAGDPKAIKDAKNAPKFRQDKF